MLKEKKVEELKEMVIVALEDENGFGLQLASSFAETTDREVIETILTDKFVEAANNVDDFNMSVEEYIIERLKSEDIDSARAYDYYENEIDANNDNFHWFDELDLWIWLPDNN